MTGNSRKAGSLREACLDEALQIIEEKGIEKLSMRDVARRLGVSHQAPYKHFSSREHILAEVIARIFDEFANHLQKHTTSTEQSFEDLHSMGIAYLRYAQEHPLKYRLMFNAPLPEPKNHPEMMRNAQKAFSMLENRLAKMELRPVDESGLSAPHLDAMFIWSTLHGYASVLQSDVLKTLDMDEEELASALERVMHRMSIAIEQV